MNDPCDEWALDPERTTWLAGFMEAFDPRRITRDNDPCDPVPHRWSAWNDLSQRFASGGLFTPSQGKPVVIGCDFGNEYIMPQIAGRRYRVISVDEELERHLASEVKPPRPHDHLIQRNERSKRRKR
jgi:hypothetical protein